METKKDHSKETYIASYKRTIAELEDILAREDGGFSWQYHKFLLYFIGINAKRKIAEVILESIKEDYNNLLNEE